MDRLESLIKRCDECGLKNCIQCEISYNDIQVIKSLIKENNDLRKENKTLKNFVSDIFNSEGDE